MNNLIYQEFSEPKRAQIIEDNSYAVNQNFVYQKAFTQEEIDKLKGDLADDLITKNSIEDELKAIKAEHKQKLTPIVARLTETLKNIKFKSREVVEEVYMIPEYDTEMMGIYNSKGQPLSSRRMIPDEKQYKLSISRNIAANE
jgi:hypothetical protein